MKDLAEEGRWDLVDAIRKAGGASVIAKSYTGMNVSASRVGYGNWTDFSFATAQIRHFVLNVLKEKEMRIPTNRELISYGQHGLRYALKLHGNRRIAQALGVEGRGRGRPAIRRKSKPSGFGVSL